MSRRRTFATTEGARLSKYGFVATILLTLAGFSSLSYSYSQDRAHRLSCEDNQRKTREALTFYQADHAGVYPQRLILLRRQFGGDPELFGRCPADPCALYVYDAATGTIRCPNPGHRPR